MLVARHFVGCRNYPEGPTRMLTAELPAVQIPLIHIVESDDLHLERQEDILWFHLLRDFPWQSFRPTAARYYEALWQFNVCQAQTRRERDVEVAANPETQSQATMRLLFERATLCEDVPALHELPACATPQIHVNPNDLRPGTTPPRWAGMKPKCFFALLKAFVGVMAQGQPAEPEIVFAALQGNPSYARTCGFTLPDPNGQYRQSDVPSLRKLEQFDQIMTTAGLWGDAAVDQVARNLKTGRIQAESTAVHDTTHYPACSGMQVVELPPAVEPSQKANATQPAREEAKPNAKGKKAKKARKKSHPKTTKRCRCKDRQHCPHPWINADEGAGTVVKSTGKMYWAHKASTLGFPRQQVLLDAVAMSDAATHDSQSVLPHLARLFTRHPDLRGIIQRVLDDGAADDQTLKATVQEQWGVQLVVSLNPRSRRPIRDDLPRGVDHITPAGTPVCQAGYPFDFLGCRHEAKRFLFRAPEDVQGLPVCRDCALREGCYRGAKGARQITVPFARLPWIDPQFPQLSRRFAKVMAKRTAIERLHKLMKYDYGDERLTKRGNAAFQARLDKTLLAMHLVLAHG
jgi:hypothetical protein